MSDNKAVKLRQSVRDKIRHIKSKVVTPCVKCKGTGYLPAEAHQVHRCDCMVVFRYLKEMVKSYLPKNPYWSLSLKDLRVEDYIMNFTKMYIQNFPRALDNGLGAVLLGPNGIGKTSVMVELGKEAIVRKYNVRYFTLTTYIDAVFGKNKELVEDLESGDLLLIDELDKTNADRLSNKIDRTVDDLLRRMANAGKAMILSTNWSEEELASVFGQSTVSLLKRTNKMLPMEGDDYGDILNDAWSHQLTEDFNYFHPNIMSMAIRLEEQSWHHE